MREFGFRALAGLRIAALRLHLVGERRFRVVIECRRPNHQHGTGALFMSLQAEPLITVTSRGLYCPPGDFYIDPWQPVQTAVITHAHGDHLRHGSARYILARPGAAIASHRLGWIRRYVGRRTMARAFPSDRPTSPCIRPGTSWAPRRSASSMGARRGWSPATTSGSRTRPAHRSSPSNAMSSSARRHSHCRCTGGRHVPGSCARSRDGGMPTGSAASHRCCSAMRWGKPSACWRSCASSPLSRSTRTAPSRP